MRIKGLAQAHGFHLPEDVGYVFVFLGEDLPGEADDGLGDALRRVRPGLRPVEQGGHEDPSDGLQGEGVVARLRVDATQRGDRGDDPVGDLYEQRGHCRVGGELGSGLGVAGLDSRRYLKALITSFGVIGASGTLGF
ncbi:hypothetical protein ABTZ93_42110 [Streptomyces sp. NPDC097941]|uniref:hypothetical protein n=1 Tax=Streptomyces sp. NPDC097941 TaxID=3155685 RepID=UPI003331BC54